MGLVDYVQIVNADVKSAENAKRAVQAAVNAHKRSERLKKARENYIKAIEDFIDCMERFCRR